MRRIDKENYYLDIAETVLERSTCLRRCYGAIIVNNDEIVSTGYNGAPRGRKNCMDLGCCTREAMRVPSGERYELCRSVHAEMNAIISAARRDTLGSTLYLARTGGQDRRAAPRRHLLFHVPPADHQRRDRAGGHPEHGDGVQRGPCGGLGPGGRLPAPAAGGGRGVTAERPVCLTFPGAGHRMDRTERGERH